MTNEPSECVYCGELLGDFIVAVEHHSSEHGNERFDPLWYSDPDDWDESDVDDIDELL